VEATPASRTRQHPRRERCASWLCALADGLAVHRHDLRLLPALSRQHAAAGRPGAVAAAAGLWIQSAAPAGVGVVRPHTTGAAHGRGGALEPVEREDFVARLAAGSDAGIEPGEGVRRGIGHLPRVGSGPGGCAAAADGEPEIEAGPAPFQQKLSLGGCPRFRVRRCESTGVGAQQRGGGSGHPRRLGGVRRPRTA